MLVSLIASSQTNTKNTTTDSVIILPKAVAREVVKDILRKDSCKTQLGILESNYRLLQKNHVYKDSIIMNQQQQLGLWNQKGKNYETMLTLKDAQYRNLELGLKPLQNELKKTKRDLVKTKIGAGAIILFLFYMAVK
jgi:hypothetical protein